MKKVLLCFVLAAVSFALPAQEKVAKKATLAKIDVNTPEFKAAMAKISAPYDFTPKQLVQVERVQVRRFQNLAEIAKFKGNDRIMYLSKLKAIGLGVDASIKRILTDRQMLKFNQLQGEKKKKESEIIKELKKKGVSRNEIRLAIIERMEEVD